MVMYNKLGWGGQCKIISVTLWGPNIICMVLLILNTHSLRVELLVDVLPNIHLILIETRTNILSRQTCEATFIFRKSHNWKPAH